MIHTLTHTFFCQFQPDPGTANPMDGLTGVAHRMVFLAIFIAIAGTAIRIFFAHQRKVRKAQSQREWYPPPPPMPGAQAPAQFQEGVFCPRCGVRSAEKYCVTCGYDLQATIQQVHAGNRA